MNDVDAGRRTAEFLGRPDERRDLVAAFEGSLGDQPADPARRAQDECSHVNPRSGCFANGPQMMTPAQMTIVLPHHVS